jgi:hypothetical protein
MSLCIFQDLPLTATIPTGGREPFWFGLDRAWHCYSVIVKNLSHTD